MEREQLILHDTSFVDLMSRRIFNVLIVANPYDAFMLEDDGRIDEKIFDEYAKLGLRYPPRFFRVATEEEAYDIINRMKFQQLWSKQDYPKEAFIGISIVKKHVR